MMIFIIALALVILSGCISPKTEVCDVPNACRIDAPATIEPIQLPKGGL